MSLWGIAVLELESHPGHNKGKNITSPKQRLDDALRVKLRSRVLYASTLYPC